MRPILVAAGRDEARIGVVVVICGSGAEIVSDIAAGWLVSLLARRRALIWFGILQLVATCGVLPIALGFTPGWLVLAVVALANAAISAAFTVVYTISMDLTRPKSAGTGFTFITTAGSVVMVLCAGLGFAASDAFGFAPVVMAAAVLCLLGLIATLRQLKHILPSSPTLVA